MALARAGYRVIGVDTDKATLGECFEGGFLAQGGTDLSVLDGCDAVIIAVPLDITTAVIRKVFAVVGTRAVITDTGSVKGAIMRELPDGIRFVGGHPMAGSEQGGIVAAKPHLYRNAYYVLCATDDGAEDLELVRGFVSDMGANPIVMSADEHDRATAKISHLPHMAAYSLVASALGGGGENSAAAKLAAGGFRDITRIASSDGGLWLSVARLNKTRLVEEMDSFLREFCALKEAVESGDTDAMGKVFARAKQLRDNIDPHMGMGIYKITLDIEDRPGIIGEVTTLLGRHKINLKNIGIEKSRSDGSGALTLEFWTVEDRDGAVSALRSQEIAAK